MLKIFIYMFLLNFNYYSTMIHEENPNSTLDLLDTENNEIDSTENNKENTIIPIIKENSPTFFKNYLLNVNMFHNLDNKNIHEEIYAQNDVGSLLLINVSEFFSFLIFSLCYRNIKIIIFFTIIHIVLIIYNTIFFFKRYNLNFIIILIIANLLFFFGTNIFLIILLMSCIRLFVIFLLFNKFFNLWKENNFY
jgi:hypothetical protein